jgi:hypothetical protein
MNYNAFYRELFSPLESIVGPLDPETIVAIAGFDVGGPLSFCTVGAKTKRQFVTYVSCELAVREEQQPSESGRYELLCNCDDEDWVRRVASDIGRMSLETAFENGHTLDISPWVDPSASIQGVVFERLYEVRIENLPFAVMRVIGVTRTELDYTYENGVDELLERLKNAGVYPNTATQRASVL